MKRRIKVVSPMNTKLEIKYWLPHQKYSGRLTTTRTGQHPVAEVYTNGTIQINRGPISERINVRSLTPYINNS
jgi:hypothetical protein